MLFLLHGQLAGSCVPVEWGANVARYAAAGFEVIAPDLSGFGETDNPRDAGGYQISQRIEHVRAFINHFNPSRYSIWGSSMGTYIGCAIALEDPRVDKLIINPSSILPPPMLDPKGPSAVPLRESVAAMIKDNPPSMESARLVLNRVMRNPTAITDELVRLFYENWKGKGEVAEDGRRAVGRPPPLFQELHRLKNPALLLWGADEALPERALLLQRCFPRSELYVLPGCAHWPQIDQADRSFDIVTHFLWRAA